MPINDVLSHYVAKDYLVRWPQKRFDLLQRPADKTEGPQWFTRCNAHGTLHPSSAVREAQLQGTLANRVQWCCGCRKAVK